METLSALLLDWLSLPRAVILAAVLVPLERVFTLHQRAPLRPGLATDLAWMFLGGILTRLGFIALLQLAFVLRDGVVPPWLPALVVAQPMWLQLIEVVLVGDLCFYWIHRLFHAVPALWRFHAVHHSIEEMDWVAGHRVHPIDQVLTKGLGFVTIILLGFAEWAVAAATMIYAFHSVLLHSNIRVKLRWLEGLVATPAFHHWHHGREQRAWNRNFAGQLSLLDRVFGTAYLPKGEAPALYGIDDPVPRSFLGQIAYPFRREEPAVQPSQAPMKAASSPPMTSTA